MKTKPHRPERQSMKRPHMYAQGADARIRGEMVIQLTPDAQHLVTEHIPDSSSGIFRNSRLGIHDVDAALQKIKVDYISRLYSSSPPLRTENKLVDCGDDANYRIWFDPEVPLSDALGTMCQVDKWVVDARPNHWREGMMDAATPAELSRHNPEQWGLEKIGCPSAWQRTDGSPQVVVAVVDSGLDLNHRDFRHHVVPGKNCVRIPRAELPDDIRLHGHFMEPTGLPWDEHGHGTHVAGTISCERRNAEGVAGVTRSCSIMPVRVLARAYDADERQLTTWGSALDIANGIKWAVNHGAQVVNLSLGMGGENRDERDAIEYAISHDVVVVAAAGNYADSLALWPAAFPDVIGVGGANREDQLMEKCSHGNHFKLCAPGDEILSTFWGRASYMFMSGSSMAAAHVSGVAALLLSLDAGLTAADVRNILLATARDMQSQPTDPNSDSRRLVDAEAALQAVRTV
ncbi:S8 family serine peptidase [Streptomyces sp. NPDC021096]|uniref:S8 family serine peptidase n=1 Tax=Streptomyces sp. NPDC021096 TaxID=3154792 RepID=UPI0033FCEE5B